MPIPLAVLGGIKLGAGLLGSLFGRKRRKKEEQQREAALQLQREAQQKIAEMASKNLETAGRYEGEARGTYGDTIDFYKTLLGDDSEAALNALLGGDRAAVNKRYSAAGQNAMQLAPRGGGRSAAIGQLEFDRQGDLFNLLMGKKGEAADKLGNLGLNLANIGQNYASLASQNTGQAYNAAAGNTNTLLGIQQANNQAGSGASALGSLLGTLMDGLSQQSSSSGSSRPRKATGFSITNLLELLGGGK